MNNLEEHELIKIIKSETNMKQYLFQYLNSIEKIDPLIWQIHFSIQKKKQMKVIDQFFDALYQNEKILCNFLPDCMIRARIYSKLKIPYRISQDKKFPFNDTISIQFNKQKQAVISKFKMYYNKNSEIRSLEFLKFEFEIENNTEIIPYSKFKEIHSKKNTRFTSKKSDELLLKTPEPINVTLQKNEISNSNRTLRQSKCTPVKLINQNNITKQNTENNFTLKTGNFEHRQSYYFDRNTRSYSTNHDSYSLESCDDSYSSEVKNSCKVIQKLKPKKEIGMLQRSQQNIKKNMSLKILNDKNNHSNFNSFLSSSSSQSSKKKKLYNNISTSKKKYNKHQAELDVLSKVLKTYTVCSSDSASSVVNKLEKLSTHSQLGSQKMITNDKLTQNIKATEYSLPQTIEISDSSASAKESNFSLLKKRKSELPKNIRRLGYKYDSSSSDDSEKIHLFKKKTTEILNSQNYYSSKSTTVSSSSNKYMNDSTNLISNSLDLIIDQEGIETNSNNKELIKETNTTKNLYDDQLNKIFYLNSNDENDSDLTYTNIDFTYVSSSSSDNLGKVDSNNYDLMVNKTTLQVDKLNREQIISKCVPFEVSKIKKINSESNSISRSISQSILPSIYNTKSSQMKQFRSLTWDELPDELELSMTTEEEKIKGIQKFLSEIQVENHANSFDSQNLIEESYDDNNSKSLDDDFFNF